MLPNRAEKWTRGVATTIELTYVGGKKEKKRAARPLIGRVKPLWTRAHKQINKRTSRHLGLQQQLFYITDKVC